MDIPGSIAVILGILSLGLVALFVASRAKFLPESSWLIGAGVVMAVIVEKFHLDTGIRAHNFHQLIFYALLPTLIFEATYSLPLSLFRRYLPLIITMATVGLLLSILICGALIALGLDLIGIGGAGWGVALLAGALLAATDPVAVVHQLRGLKAPEELGVLLEGESLFNDATAIVSFTALATLLATMGEDDFSGLGAALDFVRVFFGGIALGMAAGWLAWRAEHLLGIGDGRSSSLICLLFAYGTFYVAEHMLHVSGIMGVFAAAMVISVKHHRQLDPSIRHNIHHFWKTLGDLCNIVVFVLMGLVITVPMFTEHWMAMLIAIPAALCGRAVSVALGAAAGRYAFNSPVPASHQLVLCWGGLRGVVTVALALTLFGEVEDWFVIQSMAFGVVLFSLLVQAPSAPALMRRLKLI